MDDLAPEEFVELVAERREFLAALADERLHKPELVDRLGVSRSTVDRAIRALAEVGLVEKASGGYATTLAGRLAVERHRRHVDELGALAGVQAVLAALPADAAVPIEAVAGAEGYLATDPTPYEPRERVAEVVRNADAYRAALPTLPDPKHVRLVYEHVVTHGDPAELTASPALLATLDGEFPVRLPAMASTGRFSLRVGEVPPFGVVVTETDGEALVSVLAFGDGGTVHGVLQNDRPQAIEWAGELLDDLAAGATDETPRLAAEHGGPAADGGAERDDYPDAGAE